MNGTYRTEREYSLVEIVRYNLKMWWLALLAAVLCAALLGAYKYVSLKPYLENEAYNDLLQVRAELFISNYSDGSVAERANNVMRIAKSNRAYKAFCRETGYALELAEYQDSFGMAQTEASDVVTLYVTYPVSFDSFEILTEEDATEFADSLIAVVDEVSAQMAGERCISVLDEPYMTHEVEWLDVLSYSKAEFRGNVLKAATAGALLGLFVEVVLYTFWMLLYKKPKNAGEIQECLGTEVVDVLRGGEDDAGAFQKAAMFLGEVFKNDGSMSAGVGKPHMDAPLDDGIEETDIRGRKPGSQARQPGSQARQPEVAGSVAGRLEGAAGQAEKPVGTENMAGQPVGDGSVAGQPTGAAGQAEKLVRAENMAEQSAGAAGQTGQPVGTGSVAGQPTGAVGQEAQLTGKIRVPGRCWRVACLPIGCQKTDSALKLSMGFARGQRKTLLIDLADYTDAENAIGRFILDGEDAVRSKRVNGYLDAVCAGGAAGKEFDIAATRRFAEFLDGMDGKYECIVIGCGDVSKSAEGFFAARLCGKVLAVCRRKGVGTEALYKVKNTADINGIQIDGVLIYDF